MTDLRIGDLVECLDGIWAVDGPDFGDILEIVDIKRGVVSICGDDGSIGRECYALKFNCFDQYFYDSSNFIKVNENVSCKELLRLFNKKVG